MTRIRMAESLDLCSGNQGEWELRLLPPSFCHATAAPVPALYHIMGPLLPTVPLHFAPAGFCPLALCLRG